MNMLSIIDKHESQVRGYVRSFPTVFREASGAELWDVDGKRYIDFFGGAGALNYGHNPAPIVDAVVRYLQSGAIVHALDMATEAKVQLLQSIEGLLLSPRGLHYRVQFPGPTGTNAVEAAIKLARKATGRQNVLSFTNGFHGMTLGALSVTGNTFKRAGAGVPLTNVQFMPYSHYLGEEADTLGYLRAFLEGGSSGIDRPAAIIVESVQAEGGVNVASTAWLRGLRELTQELGVLLIMDDIQVGCGRTGPFFSFERAGIAPDIVTLSKSFSGLGFPLSIVLLAPELDVWEPGEHNGTFRGFNPAFVGARAALETYWKDDAFQRETEAKGNWVHEQMLHLSSLFPSWEVELRGLGFIHGFACVDASLPSAISRAAFEEGLLIETAGPEDEVLKFLAPLATPREHLAEGFNRLETALRRVFQQPRERNTP